MNLDVSSDMEGNARESADLKITRTKQPGRREMPSMSDNEIYLCLNVPDGLETNGSWLQKYITSSTETHADASATVIKQEAPNSNSDDSGY